MNSYLEVVFVAYQTLAIFFVVQPRRGKVKEIIFICSYLREQEEKKKKQGQTCVRTGCKVAFCGSENENHDIGHDFL